MINGFTQYDGINKYVIYFLIVSHIITFVGLSPLSAAQRVTVPSGTVVMVRTAETIDPANVRTGDIVNLIVMNDVRIQDKVVIASGATARGQVSEAKKKGAVGSPAKIAIELQTVQAVDGSNIPIRGARRMEGEDKVVLTVILGLLCLPLILLQGGDAHIPAGTTIEAFTMGIAEVNV